MLEWHSDMPHRRVVVDGSNIATEGRTTPSLAQLNEAVLSFLRDYPDAEITVVVDASFGHRIDPAELTEFEAAEAAGELVSPPAGAIGRGDAFLLRIAGKIGATVLSNDSFQEFHGEHDWLFSEGRLIGGKPVPGVGWIFTPRTPVRGVKSRKAVKEAKGQKGESLASGEPLAPMPAPSKPPPRRKAKAEATVKKAEPTAKKAEPTAKKTEPTAKKAEAPDKVADRRTKPPKEEKVVQRAIELAAVESIGEPVETGGHRRRRKRRVARPAEPVNEPLPFITFIATHKLGMDVVGEVETFTSHGAFVLADGARCYIPIVALGNPPPRAARDVLQKGEVRTFVVQALDPQRRGIELALPEYARVAGTPTEETIEAEIASAEATTGRAPKPSAVTKAAKAVKSAAKAVKVPSKGGRGAPGKKATAGRPTTDKEKVRRGGEEKAAVVERPASARRRPLTVEPSGEKVTPRAKAASATNAAAGDKPPSIKKAGTAKGATLAKKAGPTKRAAASTKAASAEKAAAKKAASAKKVASTKKAGPATKAASVKKPGSAKKAVANKKTAPNKKAGPAK